MLEDILWTFTGETSPKVELITVFLGANDAAFAPKSQYQSIEGYKASLNSIVSMIEEKLRGTNIILMSPPPICDTVYVQYCKSTGKSVDRSNENTLQYIEACREVADESQKRLKNNKIVFANTYSYFMEAAQGQNDALREYMDDGLHFKPEGHQLLFDLVSKTIEENFPEMRKENVDFDAPNWADVEKDTKTINRWGPKTTQLNY